MEWSGEGSGEGRIVSGNVLQLHLDSRHLCENLCHLLVILFVFSPQTSHRELALPSKFSFSDEAPFLSRIPRHTIIIEWVHTETIGTA